MRPGSSPSARNVLEGDAPRIVPAEHLEGGHPRIVVDGVTVRERGAHGVVDLGKRKLEAGVEQSGGERPLSPSSTPSPISPKRS